MSVATWREAIVDASAITANVRHLRVHTGAEIIAVVKADGYGHGAIQSAHAALAGGAARLGVADVTEALQLRRGGISAPILCWLHPAGARFDEAAAANIEIGVSSFDHLQAAAAASSRAPVGVHVKLETGLGRNGIPPEEYSRVFAEAARLQQAGQVQVIGIFSHLANVHASDDDDRAALRIFTDAVAAARHAGLAPAVVHLAATHAAYAFRSARLDCVRVGVGIYGLSPFDDHTSAELGLRPAMTLRASVSAVRRVRAGHGVSYGFDYRTRGETTLALIPLGYADGVPRQASGLGPVLIGGERFIVAGRIAMDQFVVDVGNHPVAVGDEAVLFGDPATGAPSVDEWAQAAGTINYDIVTGIGARVSRRWV